MLLPYLLMTANIFVVAISSPLPKYTENDAKTFIIESSEKFFDFFDDLSRITFKDDSNDNFFDVLEELKILQTAARNLTAMARETYQYPADETYTDIQTKLAMRNIRMSSYLYILGDEYFTKLLVATKHLRSFSHDQDNCNYLKQNECKMSYMPDVYRIISKSNDEKELKFYWNQFRENNGGLGYIDLSNFIELFQKAANFTGTEPLNLWYRVLMDSTFLTEMEKVMKQLEPFYKELHSYIRYQLNKQYDNNIVALNDAIPHHLYEKVLIQNWNNDHVIDPPYPDYHLPDLDKHTVKLANEIHDINDNKLLRIADKFYLSLGLTDDSVYIEDDNDKKENHIKNVDEEKSGGNDCVAQIYAQSQFYYIKACPQITFRKFLQTHGWASYSYFIKAKESLPFGNFQSFNFEQPTGEAIILSASSPKHLEEMGFITKEDSLSEQYNQNRLFKMSVHTMLNIPIFFVHSKIINDLLSDKIQIENVNIYYWKLMKEYVGVIPPMTRSGANFDFPYKFYDDLENNHQTSKFISEIAGYQIYRSLCEKTEMDQQPLHNCDIYKSKEAGKMLEDFMKLGSTKPWRETLATITGDVSGLNGEALLKYYKPISKWLYNQIENKNIPVGW